MAGRGNGSGAVEVMHRKCGATYVAGGGHVQNSVRLMKEAEGRRRGVWWQKSTGIRGRQKA